MGSWMDWQMDTCTDGQIDRYMDRQTDGQMDRWTEGHMNYQRKSAKMEKCTVFFTY